MLNGADVPIIPLTSAMQLLATVDSLKKQSQEAHTKHVKQPLNIRSQGLVSSCILGRPLAQRQTDMLMDLYPSIKSFAADIFMLENQQVLRDALGDEDYQRMVSFLSQGPQRIRN